MKLNDMVSLPNRMGTYRIGKVSRTTDSSFWVQFEGDPEEFRYRKASHSFLPYEPAHRDANVLAARVGYLSRVRWQKLPAESIHAIYQIAKFGVEK